MKIACLQFAPRLGEVEGNIQRANALIEHKAASLKNTDGRSTWLILPEMAFSGYNFQSLDEIRPFLEASCAGPSTKWAITTAQKYGVYVTVGYPEKVVASDQAERNAATNGNSDNAPAGETRNYNSTVTVDPQGMVIANYRKRFLYYTDETWALEGDGPDGFFAGYLGFPNKVSLGICMDLNPHKFLSPWENYEFANHVLTQHTPLVALSMAWLTRLTPEELMAQPLTHDENTLTYWMERLNPLREADATTVVVCANRCGVEGNAAYAGSTAVFIFRGNGRVEIQDMCGKLEEKCMVVDLNTKPKYAVQRGSS